MSLSKRSKIIITVIVVIAIAVFAVYKYSMLPPAQIEDRAVEFTGTSEQLLSKIQEDADAWQDRVVIISGKISSFDEKGFTISSAIYCQMKDAKKLNSLSSDQVVSLKGRVIGYDDLLEEVKLDQCIIQQQP
ncbi:MAG: hypothetical protein JXR05_15665 [Flavobacteriaceae bacterium]